MSIHPTKHVHSSYNTCPSILQHMSIHPTTHVHPSPDYQNHTFESSHPAFVNAGPSGGNRYKLWRHLDEIYLTDGFYLIPVLLLVQGSQSSLQKGSEEIQKLRNNTEISIKLYSFKLVKTELKDHQVHLQLGDWRSTIKYKRGSSTNFEYLAPEKAHTANNSENLSLLLNEINQEYTLSFSGKDSSSRDSIISIYSLLPASGMDRDPEKSSNKESSKGKEKQINHREPDENSQCLCLTSKTMSRKKNKFWAIPADQMEVLDAIPEWKSTYEPNSRVFYNQISRN
ncbi:hypothetical protein Btru_072403 [Bulinus truncatus]|nr:hypothetical protein Btru_072403 [Bulinus truncatus]